MKRKPLASFARTIMNWDLDIDRGMPWQGERQPYLIWLSEILLQQTRVEQGLPYYLKFKETYPTIADLANAADDDVFRLWQGLGYYSRCRNLLHTARYIATDLGGVFPNSYEEILKLKGVGPYTAAAIASFAYDTPIAVVDGNVKRVIARYIGIETPIDSRDGDLEIKALADAAMSTVKDPASYNQAIMNFGATQCKPKKALCASCPLNGECYAYKNDLVSVLPRKEKKIKKRSRYFIYLHIVSADYVLIHHRMKKDIWQMLYDLPLIEVSDNMFDQFKLSKNNIPIDISINKLKEITSFGPFKQQLTHQRIHGRFLKFSVDKRLEVADKNYLWVKKTDLDSYGFPKLVFDYLSSKKLQRTLPFA